jgi:hypothetical protein
MRITSLEAYNTLHTKGFLTGLQAKVYDVLYNNGPLTQGEAWNEYLVDYQRHSVDPRFAELQKMGVIATIGTRPCRLTGQKCIEWDVTDHIPTEKPVHVPKMKLADEAPGIIALLEKLDTYFSNLPEDSKQEVLHYDVNQLKERLG